MEKKDLELADMRKRLEQYKNAAPKVDTNLQEARELAARDKELKK